MIYVLMPVYNGIEFIDNAVTSVNNQTYKDWHLIIGVNGHPANSETYNIAKGYNSTRCCERGGQITVLDLHEINTKSGALNAMMTWILAAASIGADDWVSLLDVDDIWFPTKLSQQLPFCQDYDVIGTQCQYFGDRSGSPSIPTGDITTFDFSKVNPVINSSCLIRAKHARWRDLDIHQGTAEDYDLWLTLWQQGCHFYNVNEILVLHRIHRGSGYNSKGHDTRGLLKSHGYGT
jgi:glycosyltransferase involved in cell wall biosynthesis